MADLFTILRCVRNKSVVPVDDEPAPPAFLLNKWLSFHSLQMCWVINQFANSKNSPLTNEEHVKFLHHVLPRTSAKKITYIKKPKPEKDPDQGEIEKVAKLLEISKREAKSYIELTRV